jgi:hypothetical protein
MYDVQYIKTQLVPHREHTLPPLERSTNYVEKIIVVCFDNRTKCMWTKRIFKLDTCSIHQALKG